MDAAVFIAATVLLSIWSAAVSGEDSTTAPRGDTPAASETGKAEPGLLNTQEVMRRMPLDYPPDALEKGIGGYVLVQFSLPDDGRPQRPVVVMSDPKGVFESAALERLRIMQFTVPAEWVAEHPNRRHELVLMYHVWGTKPRESPGFNARAILTIGRKERP